MISLPFLRGIEGRQVTVMLTDGTRFDDCHLVSVGRLWARSVWLAKGDADLFVSPDEIANIFVLDRQEAA